MKALIRALAVLCTTAALVPAAQARVHDHIFAGEFETITDLPADANEAARFLTQATFGPIQADIDRVMKVGYGEWIEEQMGMPPTLGFSVVEDVINKRSAVTVNPPGISNTQRINRWLWQATYAPDQLRQRMAFALSQIFVVSDQTSSVSQDIVPMTGYQDLLATDAFNIYVNVLHDVTFNPTMGKYLSHFRNQRGNCSGTNPVVCTTLPDENYAREVMQLFSVGLILLDTDGSPLNGAVTPTYDQSVITHTAKVFTGFTYSDAPTNPPNFYNTTASFETATAPMACWGTELFPDPTNSNMRHDITGDDGTQLTNKTVLDNNTILPSQTCAKDVSDELNIINEHPNVAPFISRLLIQRFVTSNPSPQYIQRVATVFENNGYSDRGDLGDVVKAILTDTEARNPPSVATDPTYGKLREPLLRLTAMWRAFSAVAPAKDKYDEVAMTGGVGFLGSYGQAPLESPTVFNFYDPSYVQPGTLDVANKVAPEFQLANEASIYSMTNSFYGFTSGAYVGMTNPPVDRPLINLSVLTANPTGNAIADTINATMLYGTMSSDMHDTISGMVTFMGSAATAQEKAWSAIYLTMLSPEYASQR